jgi:16S rRNA (guanine966-N2)-methyltransferase
VVPGVRPTTERARAAIFNVLAPAVYRDAKILDLFAGTGSLGIEGLSLGAGWADFVERDRRQSEVIRSNLEATGFTERARVHCLDANRALAALSGPYQLVLMDPPYRMVDLTEFMERLAATPGLIDPGGVVVVGHSQRVDLLENYGELVLYSHRRYGDNVLDFYSWGGD